MYFLQYLEHSQSLRACSCSLTVLEMFSHDSTPSEFRVSMYFLQYSRRDSAASRPPPSRLPVSPPVSPPLSFAPCSANPTMPITSTYNACNGGLAFSRVLYIPQASPHLKSTCMGRFGSEIFPATRLDIPRKIHITRMSRMIPKKNYP